MQPWLRQAIARIDIMQGDRSAGHGTGCLVAPDLVLTAMHVVADRQASPPSLLAGTIVLTFPTHRCEAAVVDGRWDPRSDWALLRCATPPPGVRPVPLADSVTDGEAWETFGFPDANSRDGLAQLGTVENANGTFETVAAYQLFSRQAAAGVGAPVKGLSGGPVIVDGAVVGVFRSSLMREGQFNVAGTLYACPVDAVLARCADLLPIPDPCRGLPGLPRQPLPPAPYRFLERFTARDAEIFFGRNREIRDLYDRVTAKDSASIVLLYGQSGAGKSSFLDAGLLPRLASSHATLYVRRDRSKGLLRTLIDAMAQAFPATLVSDSWAVAWLKIEANTARPLVVILDQVEEAFTLPSADANEVANLVEAVRTLVAHVPRLQGRLILGFRKEWLGEIQKPLDQHGLDYSKVFLEALDAEAVTEVATGLTHTRRLRDRYGLSVEDGLAASIASDLTADRESPVAPTLQVLLSRMWGEATKASSGSPAFTADLYARITREGVLLTDFLDHQLVALAEAARAAGGPVADVVESGLALDVLRYHVSRLGTAEERSAQQLIDEYHRDDDVAWLVGELKRLYLLTEPSGDGASIGATRLAHDTLAPAVRTRCDESLLPGQRARRLLEGRAGEWADGKVGTPLDWRDLMRVEQGATGMRALHPDEERMVEASRAVRRQDTARSRTLKWAAAAAVVVVLGASVAAWIYRQQNVADQAWRALVGDAGSIPTVLAAQPTLGLALAIDALDRSLALNRGTAPVTMQQGLALALESARERYEWALPATGVAIAMSRDRRVAVGTAAGEIRVFSLDAADPPQVIAAASGPIGAVSFSDDGEFIAAGLAGEGIGVWRRSGQRVAELPSALAAYAQSVKFAPGGHTLVALIGPLIGPTDLYLYDLDTRMSDTTPASPYGGSSRPHRPLEVVRNGDNDLVVATEFRDQVHMTTARNGQWQSPVEAGTFAPGLSFFDVAALALTRRFDGRVVLAVASRDRVAVVDVARRRLLTDVNEPDTEFIQVRFGAEGRSLITGARDGQVRAYGEFGQPGPSPVSLSFSVDALAVADDGELAAVAGAGPAPLLSVIDMVGVEAHLESRARWDWILSPSPGFMRSSLAFLPGGRLAAAGPDQSTRIWELELKPGRSAIVARTIYELAPDPLSTIVVADTAGTTVAVIGGNRGVRLFGPDGAAKGGWQLPMGVTAAALSPDGRILVTGSQFGTLDVTEVPAGTPIRQGTVRPNLARQTSANPVHAVAFDVGGQRFAASFADGHLRIYDRNGSEIDDLPGQPEIETTALAFLPDGDIIYGTSRGDVGSVRTDTGRPRFNVRVFPGRVNSLALHPSESTLFVAGLQGLRALDLASRALMDLPMSRTTRPLATVAVSPDGRVLAAIDADSGRFFFWRAGWQEWLSAACDRLRRHEAFASVARPGVGVGTALGFTSEPYRAFDACSRRAPAGPP